MDILGKFMTPGYLIGLLIIQLIMAIIGLFFVKKRKDFSMIYVVASIAVFLYCSSCFYSVLQIGFQDFNIINFVFDILDKKIQTNTNIFAGEITPFVVAWNEANPILFMSVLVATIVEIVAGVWIWKEG